MVGTHYAYIFFIPIKMKYFSKQDVNQKNLRGKIYFTFTTNNRRKELFVREFSFNCQINTLLLKLTLVPNQRKHLTNPNLIDDAFEFELRNSTERMTCNKYFLQFLKLNVHFAKEPTRICRQYTAKWSLVLPSW